MNYMDIPYASLTKEVSLINKINRREKVMKDIRKAIVKAINESSREGAFQTMLIPSEFRRDCPIYKLFSWYDEYKGVLDEFTTKGYMVTYVESMESKICGTADTPPYILIEWHGNNINLEKGDDK